MISHLREWIRMILIALSHARAFARVDLLTLKTNKERVVTMFIAPILLTIIPIYQYLSLGSEAFVGARFFRVTGTTDFIGFLIYGTMIQLIVGNLLFRAGQSIARERDAGTLDALFIAPTSRMGMSLGKSVIPVLEALIYLLVMTALYWMVFGRLAFSSNLFVIILTLLVVISTMLSLGSFIASFFMLTRASRTIARAARPVISFFSGFRYPVEVIPMQLRLFSLFLPTTYAVFVLRNNVLIGSLDLLSIIILTGFGVAAGLSSLIIWDVLEEHAKKTGRHTLA